MADLKTTYKDDLLDTSVNEKRKYNMIQNADGTVSFEDVTTYSQIGDSFGAADINATNNKVNEVNSNLSANIIDSYSAVDLTLYTSTNPYTCPSDGYVNMKCYNQPGNHTTLNILTNKNDYILARCQGDLTNTDFKIIYVKKGMRIYGTVSNSSYAAISYIPFI